MKLLSYAELKKEKGVSYSRSHLRRLIQQRLFPPPIEIGPGRQFWVSEEVDAYVRQRMEQRDAARTA